MDEGKWLHLGVGAEHVTVTGDERCIQGMMGGQSRTSHAHWQTQASRRDMRLPGQCSVDHTSFAVLEELLKIPRLLSKRRELNRHWVVGVS